MHAMSRRSTEIRPFQSLFLVVLLVGLGVGGTGCEGAGSNGDSGGQVPAPSNLTATSGDSEISLSWEAVDAAEAYNVYRSTSSTDGAEGNPVKSGVSSPSYTDPTVENGTAYYYRITAVDGVENESDASGEVKKTPFSAPPSQP